MFQKNGKDLTCPLYNVAPPGLKGVFSKFPGFAALEAATAWAKNISPSGLISILYLFT